MSAQICHSLSQPQGPRSPQGLAEALAEPEAALVRLKKLIVSAGPRGASALEILFPASHCPQSLSLQQLRVQTDNLTRAMISELLAALSS